MKTKSTNNLLQINLTQELSLEELKHFFSHTHEYKVTETNPDTYRITYNSILNGTMEHLIYKPTLLRDLQSIHYLEGHEHALKEIK